MNVILVCMDRRSNFLKDKFVVGSLCPPPKEKGTYCFGADPVGVGVNVVVGVSVTISCVHDIS